MSQQYNAHQIASALGQGKEVRLGENSWNTVCPAHADNGPSLTVTDGTGGKILVHCHAGCKPTEVIDKLRDMQLWPSRTSSESRKFEKEKFIVTSWAPDNAPSPKDMKHPRYGTPKKSWRYKTADGKHTVGFYARFDYVTPDGKPAKELLPIAWGVHQDTGEGRWLWKGFNKPRPLYRGEFIKLNPTADVVIVEGEKTCDAAVRLLDDDVVVVTWPGGGKAVQHTDWSALEGRRVIIWPDADEVGTHTGVVLAEHALAAGAARVRLVELPTGLAEADKGWDLADEQPPGFKFDPRVLVKAAPDYLPASGDVIEAWNKQYAVVLVGDKAMVLFEEQVIDNNEAIDIKFVTPSAFHQLYSNKYTPIGRKEIPTSKYWINHPERRTYKGVTFAPGRTTHNLYNLWRGFKYEPDPLGDWSLFDEHIRENIAKGDESLYAWLVGWFAQVIQHPDKKTGTSVAIRGKQGTGKTVLGQHMGALYPAHYVLVDDPRYVTGQFNSHMASALMLHADEGFWAGDPRHVGRLRGMVTSKTHFIENKGKDPIEIKNFMRLLITSNNAWLVPAGFEERRFAALDMGTGKMQNGDYFAAMERQLLDGGYEGLLHSLLNWDLSTINLARTPKTGALDDQKTLSLDPIPRFWYERLVDGEIIPNAGLGWPDEIGSEQLYNAFVDRAIKWGERRRSSDIQFGRELKALMPHGELDRKRIQARVLDNFGHVETRRVWGYKIPRLNQCRAAWDALTSSKTDWGEQDVADLALDDVPF